MKVGARVVTIDSRDTGVITALPSPDDYEHDGSVEVQFDGEDKPRWVGRGYLR